MSETREMSGIMLCEHGWYQCEKCVGARVETKLDDIAESQGKLLAAVDEHEGLLAKAIDHIRVSLNSLDGKVQAIGGVLAELLASRSPANRDNAPNRPAGSKKRVLGRRRA